MSIPPIAASAMELPAPIVFRLFGFEVYWLGLLLAIGVIVAIMLTHMECRRKALPPDTAVDLCLLALPCGVIGARIFYVLLHLPQFRGNALSALYIWDGGLSAAGGALCALIAIWVYARRKRIRFCRLLDALAPGVCAALAISIWGCFFDQSFYGPSVTASALKWFPLCVRLDGGGIHLALFFYLFVWLVLLFVFLRFFLSRRARHDGDTALAFILLFCPAFALLSALRQDGGPGYEAEHIASAALFLLALLYLLVRNVREARLSKLIRPAPAEASAAETAEEPLAEAPKEPAEEAAEPMKEDGGSPPEEKGEDERE